MSSDDRKSTVEHLQRIAAQPSASERAARGRRITETLGHDPEMALRAMRDYGLSDREIARYYEITPSTVRRLERLLGIDDA